MRMTRMRQTNGMEIQMKSTNAKSDSAQNV